MTPYVEELLAPVAGVLSSARAMPGALTGHTLEPDPEPPDESAPGADSRALRSVELTAWLRERIPELRDQWVHELHRRGAGHAAVGEGLIELFGERVVGLLPMLLGPYRDQVAPLWDRGFELFGVVAAKRGLAAGEAIEELHVLRELVIRELYRTPPHGGAEPLSLREVLRLNRALDRAVTLVSVGHTDALFFEFFEIEGAASALGAEDVIEEAREQLEAIWAEAELVARHAAAGAHREN